MNVEDIHKIEKHRKKIKKEIYVKIYEQFSRKIKNAVHMNQIQVFLKVPSFLIGYPTYDLIKAATYLERQLINSGFNVVRFDNINFHISWNKKRKNRKKEEEEEEEDNFPTLVNLKKTANKLRQ
jgi:hypothetical protein